jgi:hypothetical protein
MNRARAGRKNRRWHQRKQGIFGTADFHRAVERLAAAYNKFIQCQFPVFSCQLEAV